MKKVAFLCAQFLLLLLSIYCIAIPAKAAPGLQEFGDELVIVIDPGHGGENEGTKENGTPEKEMNMVTALAMYEELSKYDNVKVYLTRTEDVDMSLAERAEFAASVNADFLFSLHYNASEEHVLFGTEVWISSVPPFHAYGYQFGCVHLQNMQEKGLFLRGIKTRLNTKGKDYYGIIREAVEREIPVALIEHCHVDHPNESDFCDALEDWEEFGRIDAKSVAQYLGLEPYNLEFPQVKEKALIAGTLLDETGPDICNLELIRQENDTGNITVSITAADYDTPLIYYDYSIDGGKTYSERISWPGSNALTGAYQDTFQTTICIPSGVQPSIIVRAYNLFDRYTCSNELAIMHLFYYGESQIERPTAAPVQKENYLPGTTTFQTTDGEGVTEENNSFDFLTFIKLCLFVGIIIILLALFAQKLNKRKRRRSRQKSIWEQEPPK